MRVWNDVGSGLIFLGCHRPWMAAKPGPLLLCQRCSEWNGPGVVFFFPMGRWWTIYTLMMLYPTTHLFPRASERRILPIVGVCKTSSHLHIFSSSHLLIFTTSHLHNFSPSHLLIFTSSHLLIFTSSHLLIFTSSHFHIFSSSHLLLLPSCPLALSSSHLLILTSSPLALLLSPSFLFLSWLRGAVPTRRHETQPFRTKWGSITKNWCKIAISSRPAQPFRAKCVKLRFQLVPRNPFARDEVRSPKTDVKIAISTCPVQPFRTKRGSIAKNWCKNYDFNLSLATLLHEMKFDRQKLL